MNGFAGMLCEEDVPEDQGDNPADQEDDSTVAIIGGVAAVAIVLIVATSVTIITVCCTRKHKRLFQLTEHDSIWCTL